jgi:hypothetical protein
MDNWEIAFTNKQVGTKYEGDDYHILFVDPVWIKGFRYVMKSVKPFICKYNNLILSNCINTLLYLTIHCVILR